MVTLQAKQQPHQQQQQHQQTQLKESRVQDSIIEQERETVASAVAEKSCWSQQQHQQLNGENENKIVDWMVPKVGVTSLKNTKREDCIGSDQTVGIREETSPVSGSHRNYGNAFGSNGESTQCSDIEDDDDNDVDDEDYRKEEFALAEKEEETEDEDDDDDDECPDEVERSDSWMKQKTVTTRVHHETSFEENGNQRQVLPNLDPTTFGEVAITNSRHVHVGNTNFYKGPVTIKQFVYTNAYPVQDKENSALSNNAEGNCSARVSDINPNDLPSYKSDPNGPILPTYRDYDKVSKWLWTWRCAAILCVVALSLVTIIVVVSVIVSRAADGSKMLADSPTSGIDPDVILADSVRFIEREVWGAQPPSEELDKLNEVPTPYVIISHTATTPCTKQSECVLRVRVAQTLHIEGFKWSDIGYNFLVGGDGLAYVGRGWDAAGAHAFGYNYNSIGISFIGTFNDVAPPKRQLHAALKVIEMGIKLGKISPTYKLLGHRQVSETLSPGDQLYKILTTWDHWSPTPRPKPSRASISHPHQAVIIPVILLVIPHLLMLIQISLRFLIRTVIGRNSAGILIIFNIFYQL